ncbi:MAG: N-acetylmuramoyl-L-alanine amidase [Actinomycetota bacterium]
MKRAPLVVLAALTIIVSLQVAVPAKTIYIPRSLSGTVSERGAAVTRLDFPATHVMFKWTGDEGTGVVFRTVRADGADEWQVAEEAHDLEDGDTHYSGVYYVGRAERLEWRPVKLPDPPASEVTARAWRGDDLQPVKPGELARTSTRPGALVRMDYVNTSDGPLEARTVPAVAQAQASTPRMVSRSEWGADESSKRTTGSCKRQFYPLQQLFVHHTAGSNNDPNSYATMRAIYYFHTQSRGWCDLGYNFVIGSDGTIFEGRWARKFNSWETPNSENPAGHAVAGAHVSGYNSGSIGISMMGNFTSAKVTLAARDSLVRTLAWVMDRHNLDPLPQHTYRNPDTGHTRKLPRMAGHRDAGQTACPGTTLYNDLPNLRRDVAAMIAGGRMTPSLDLRGAPVKLQYGEGTTITGTLRDEQGAPMVVKPVTLYSRPHGGRWTIVDQKLTGADGSFSYTTEPSRNSKFGATYPGDASTWERQSSVVTIKVKAIVTLQTQGGTSEGSIMRYEPGTRKVTFGGDVTPALPDRTIKVKIFKVRPDGTEKFVRDKFPKLDATGSYTSGFQPRRVGHVYRVATWNPRGKGYAASRSPSVFFTVAE